MGTTELLISSNDSSSTIKQGNGSDLDPAREVKAASESEALHDSAPSTTSRRTETSDVGRITVSEDDSMACDTLEKIERDGCDRVLNSLTDEEKERLADANMVLRHFRAEKGDVETASKKLKATIAWRQEFGVEKIKTCFEKDGDEEMREILSLENATGKIYVRGYDREGRAVLYLRPGLENTRHELNNMRHLTYQLERAVACTSRKCDKEKINIVIDYEGFSLWNAPPMSTTMYTADILQNHYPERLHKAFICNPPLVFRTFWTMASPFIDPMTKEKVLFCSGEVAMEKLKESFDLETMEQCAGGTKKLRDFDSREYLSLPFNETFDEKPV